MNVRTVMDTNMNRPISNGGVEATEALAELALITVTDPPTEDAAPSRAAAKRSWDGVEDVSLTVISGGRPESVVSPACLRSN
jgi:hypothetical protein